MGSMGGYKVHPGPVDLKDVVVKKSPFNQRRTCTDVICLWILLLFFIVFIGLLIYCINIGDINRITLGYDYCGNICGHVTERVGVAPDTDRKYNCLGSDMRKHRFLLVWNAGQRETNYANVNRECVASCKYYHDFRDFNYRCIPKKGNSSSGSVGNSGGGGLVVPVQQLAEAVPEVPKWRNVSVPVLVEPATLDSSENNGFPDILLPDNRSRRHAAEVVHGRQLLQYQQPPVKLNATDLIDVHFSKTGYPDFYQEVAEDLDLCWKELLALYFIALGFTIVIMLFLILAMKLVVIMSLSVGIGVSLFATIFLLVKWGIEKNRLAEKYRLNPYSISKIENRLVDSYLGYASASTIITGIVIVVLVILLVVLVCCKRKNKVIKLFEESGSAIWEMPALLILPWLSFAIVGGLITTWLYLALWIESSGRLVGENNMNFFYERDIVAGVARWWNLLTLFWLIQFVMACQHLIVAGAVCDWYFTKDQLYMRHTIIRSMGRTIHYHLGSAAIGATLVGPLHFLRVVIKQVLRMLATSNNPATSLCSCITQPLDKFIALISINAYVEVALRGCNFPEGGPRAMAIIKKIISLITDISEAGDLLLFMTKIGVMMSTMLVAIFFIQDKEGVMHVWVPITLATIFGYVVAHIFISVYEMVIDALFICFCEDFKNINVLHKLFFLIKEFF